MLTETHNGIVLQTPIQAHIKLDFCWVCKLAGTEAKLHDHHVVPTAFGGKDGPQVTLCSSHHNSLHDAAKLLYTHKGVLQVVVDKYRALKLKPLEFQRFLYLVQCVYRADVASRESKHKTMGNMNRRSHTKLVAITQHLGVSQPLAIEKAIDLLHQQLFGV